MTKRMTDDRLAEINRIMSGYAVRDSYEDELVHALKAERENAEDLESEYSLLLARNNVLSERISELEAKLARVEKLPEKWRDKYDEAVKKAAVLTSGYEIVEVCASDLEAELRANTQALEQDGE